MQLFGKKGRPLTRSARSVGDGDEGAALVEMAMVLLLLVGMFIGMAEMGLAFRDYLSITSATRAGVRVASAIGNGAGLDPTLNADCFILEATAGTLISVPIDSVQEVWVFKADSNGNPTGTQNRYRPGANIQDPTDLLDCNAGWTMIGGSNWPASMRNVGTNNLDIVGIRIDFDHEWITGFPPFNGTVSWTDDAVMRMEPQFFG